MQNNSKYFDADVLTPFDPSDERYRHSYVQTIALKRDSKNWKLDNRTPDVATFIKHLAQHPEDKKKDGLGFVPGDMLPGQRKDSAVKSLCAVVLDCDLDPDLEAVADAMARSGKCCVLYTTFTHLKATTEIKRDELTKFAPGQDHDAALVSRYLAEKRHWPVRLTDTVEVEPGLKPTTEGLMVVVRHKPMTKCRIVFPLKTPFAVADCPSLPAAKEKWRKVYLAVAESLGLADQIDKTGADINRFFYHPRHAPGAEHVTLLCGGDLLDVSELELENPWDAEAEAVAGKSKDNKSKTAEGKALASWSRKYAGGFQIADTIRDHCAERIREDKGDKLEIECPNDAAHSNAGDSDDRACIAINVGEGRSEIFTVSCRHDSCHGMTALDMLGMMLEDEWFPRSALTDSTYNANIEGGGADNGKDKTESSVGLTVDSVREQIAEMGEKPDAESLDALLDRIKGVSDDGDRRVMFNVIRDSLKGDKKKDVERARSEAKKKWGDETKTVKAVAVKRTTPTIIADIAFPNLEPGNNSDLPDSIVYRYVGEQRFVANSYGNCLTLLTRESFQVGFDEIACAFFFLSDDLPWKSKKREITEASLRTLRHYLLVKWDVEFSKENVREACLTLAGHNSFNPIADYFDSLKWDGVKRIDTWLRDYCGAADTPYTRAVSPLFLCGAVRRGTKPGSKFDTMLVLESLQGAGKSTLAQILGGKWYSGSTLGDLTNKDAAITLQGVLINEFPELAKLLRAHPDDIKAFLSLAEDRYRAPYDAGPSTHPRHTVFIGTINPRDEGYLTDDTGNRRFWPVKIGRRIKLDDLRRDRDQLWAEAVAREKDLPEPITLPEELWPVAAKEQSARMVTHPWRDALEEFIAREADAHPGKLLRFTTNRLFRELGYVDAKGLAKKDKQTLRNVMESLGFRPSDGVRDGAFVGKGYEEVSDDD